MLHACSHCNIAFTANRKDKRYCSNSCKQMAFIKRQEKSVGFVFEKHQNVNNTKHQVNETSIGQNVKPSINTLPSDIEKLKKELNAFAEVVIQNKLDELLQNSNLSSMPNATNFNTNLHSDLDLFGDKQAIIKSLQDDENNNTVHEQTQASTKIQTAKPSIVTIDGFTKKTVNSKTVQPTILIEEKNYMPITCKWITKLYERFNERATDEKLNALATTYKDKMNPVEWISIHYRCLLECVITIAEIKVVAWNDLAELTNAFTFLITSVYFNELPNNYPFTNDIIFLRDKLKHFCLETRNENDVTFRLKFDTKKELFLHRFELSMVFAKISFNQLQCNFKNENNKLNN